MLEAVMEHVRDKAAELCGSGHVPGYLAGVYHGGEQTVVAEGVANIATGAPMTDDTGYLIGSITKVMTATLAMQAIERGQLDLDERVTTYLPDFELAKPSKFEELRVRHLLNHTNGIDCDFYWPNEVTGPAALAYCIHELRRWPTLFDPGEYICYSNGGMLVLGRLLEVVTGATYHALLEREVYGPVGMTRSSNSPQDAILGRTAVGHFPDPSTGGVRRTDMFMLPESWSAAGATPINTIGDLLAFARVHLAAGVAPTGERVLSAESVERMRTITVDMGVPNVSPIGLGWPFLPWGDTTVLTHGGASPGGTATLLVVPEHDFAFAAFGNAGAAGRTSDELVVWLLGEYLGLGFPKVVSGPPDTDVDLTSLEGAYGSCQFRVDVKAVDGQLEETMTFEPLDEEQERAFHGFSGGTFPFPPYRLEPVGDGLFGPVGVPLEAFQGTSRVRLASYFGGAGDKPEYRLMGGRITRRLQG
jgi:CubicO group peptidase (beta-lactamase class C family)